MENRHFSIGQMVMMYAIHTKRTHNQVYFIDVMMSIIGMRRRMKRKKSVLFLVFIKIFPVFSVCWSSAQSR